MKDLLIISIMSALIILYFFNTTSIYKLNKEIAISRDHEKRLAVENQFREHDIRVLDTMQKKLTVENNMCQYEIAVLTDTVLKGK